MDGRVYEIDPHYGKVTIHRSDQYFGRRPYCECSRLS